MDRFFSLIILTESLFTCTHYLYVRSKRGIYVPAIGELYIECSSGFVVVVVVVVVVLGGLAFRFLFHAYCDEERL